MLLNFLKNKSLDLAKKGGEKFLSAIQNHIEDCNLVYQINDRIDSELFLSAIKTGQYKHVEDIKEDNIYDQFIELCLNQKINNSDIITFVNTHYPHKSKKAKRYIVSFFNSLNSIVYKVLIDHASFETKLIIRGQEQTAKTLLTALQNLEAKIAQMQKLDTPTTVVTYCANMQNNRWSINNYQDALNEKHIHNTIDLSLKNSTLDQNDGSSFWDIERRSLNYNFRRNVLPLLESGLSISLFSLAPIPLLIYLGRLFANRPNVDVYQLRKQPSTWEWEQNADPLIINRINHYTPPKLQLKL